MPFNKITINFYTLQFTPELHPNRIAQDKSSRTKREKGKKISVYNARNGIKQSN